MSSHEYPDYSDFSQLWDGDSHAKHGSLSGREEWVILSPGKIIPLSLMGVELPDNKIPVEFIPIHDHRDFDRLSDEQKDEIRAAGEGIVEALDAFFDNLDRKGQFFS